MARRRIVRFVIPSGARPARRRRAAAGTFAALALAPALAGAVTWLDRDGRPLPFTSQAEALDFLRRAEAAEWTPVEQGTNPRKRVVILRQGGVAARAVLRYMYEHKPQARGFLDSYLSEVAAYELAGLLGFDNVPPVLVRRLGGRRGSLQLWIEGATPYAAWRAARPGSELPAPLARRLDTLRVFDALIANEDRNPGNILIGQAGETWWIDHTRSFGGREELRGLDDVHSCDRRMWQGLLRLQEEGLRARLRPYTPYFEALLARRRLLLAWLESRQGEERFFYEEATAGGVSAEASSEPGYTPAVITTRGPLRW